MNIQKGYAYTHQVSETTYLDISIFPGKFATTVSMGLRETDRSAVLATLEKRYFNWEKLIPKKWAEKIAFNSLNKHSKKVAGIPIADEPVDR